MDFNAWYSQFIETGSIKPLHFGMSRRELEEILGPPDDKGRTSRKHRTPSIYKYRDLEFFFEHWQQGGLRALYREDSTGHCDLHICQDDRQDKLM